MTLSNNLNRGLTGYVVNGTNKAVTVVDRNGKVVPARRIVRLRIIEDENGQKMPVIFVEESTQFGVTHIDELYGLLDELSRRTGLPVIATHHRPATTEKVLGGKNKSFKIHVFPGRSSFDYSDEYGNTMSGVLTAGLYQHLPEQGELITPEFELLVKPNPGMENDRGIKFTKTDAAMNFLSNIKNNSIQKKQELGFKNVRAPGGIDLNPVDDTLQINSKGEAIKFNIDPALYEQLKAVPGFTPIIINVAPLKDLKVFLGI
ncbi:MAG: hypothetical protein HQL26_07975 [Candidatus Omnitrophica bacterium]|nr:hypothetical protein [Candidatus Omnitrophota bacterium]